MHRLRRKNDCSLGLPVAAEVLESRALLSAGAAAVHAATQHAAALHPDKHHATQNTTASFQGTVVAAQTAAGGDPYYRGATLSVASFTPLTGAHASANFKISQKFGNSTYAFAGTFKGLITAVNPLGGNDVEYDVQPIGSVTLSINGGKAKAPSDGTPLKLYYGSGLFQELSVSVVFPPSASLGNLPINFDLKPHL